MRVTVEVDGKATEVDVADGATEVRVGSTSFPVKVIAVGPTRIELEIGGEKVTVEGWVQGQDAPTEPVTLNGERFRVAVKVAEGARPPAPLSPPAPARPPSVDSAPTSPSEGTVIVPPMPGKVVELRVKEGERVAAGQVLLVLEAMKMRNEVTAPVAGIVHGLSVSAGANVRARERMLTIVP